MKKLVVINLGKGNFEQGFPDVSLEIGNEGERPTTRTQGNLLPSPEVEEYYDKWHSAYRSLGGNSRLGGKAGQNKNVSLDEIKKNANLLKEKLNLWLNSESFRPIKDTLLDVSDQNDEMRIIIQTEDVKIREIPWQLWNFFDRRAKAEVALAKLEYQQPDKKPYSRNSIRILAILGNCTGINVKTDKQQLENLPHAKTEFLIEPQRQKLDQYLWDDQGWDIISFSGHSRTEDKTGKIDINPTESLTIADLEHALKNSIAHGLELALFNSCDGLGIAWQLEKLQIPQFIVMREPVPDQVAQEFLKSFLQAFSKDKSFYLAVKEARQQLQGLEGQFPNASWLPVICQHPAVEPPSWNQLYRIEEEPAKDESPTKNKPPKYHNLPGGVAENEFFGREQVLLKLHEQIQKNDQVAICAAIEGMGGIGKTELARQYALRHSQFYQGGICWLNASAKQNIGDQIIEFAEDQFGIKIPEKRRDLQSQLSYCWSKWHEGNVLIVFDDVNNYQDVSLYLPSQPSLFNVLITTRLDLDVSKLELEVLEKEASLNLLRLRLGKERIPEEKKERIPEKKEESEKLKDAKKLCEWLGYLPLALQLVARYMEQDPDLTLKEMLNLLKEEKLKQESLIRYEDDPAWTLPYLYGVAAAFELSWKKLNSEAQQLGGLLSLFALASIPRSLIEHTAIIKSNSLRRAISKLMLFHLLKRTDDKTYQLHQLIREFFQEKLEELPNKDEITQAFVTAMVAEAKQIPDTPDDHHSFKELTITKPHIEELANNQTLNDENIYWPFIGLARFYNGQGLYDQVEHWCEKGLSTSQERFGKTVPSDAQEMVAILWLLQAKALRIQGEYEQAIQNYQQSLDILPETQPGQKIRAYRGLGHVYRLQGEHDESIQNYEASCNLAQTIKDDKGETRAAYGIARVERLRGELKNAELHYQKAIKDFKKLELRVDEAWALFGLAEVQRMMGNIKQSTKNYSESLDLFKELKHKEGEAYAAWGVGETNRLCGESEAKNGNFEKAKNYLSTAKENQENSLNLCQEIGDRRSKAWAVLGLAEIFRMEGKYQSSSQEDAIAKYQEALDKYEQAYSLVVNKECIETAHALLGIAATKRLLNLAKAEESSDKKIFDAYTKALDTYQDHNMNYCIVYVLTDTALYYLSQADQKQAQLYLNRAEKICVENDYAKEQDLIDKIREEQDGSELHTLNFP